MFFNRVPVSSVLLVASVLAPALSARAQNGGTMFVTSANSKNAVITGKEGSRFIDFRHSIVSPRDPQSGLPTGQRQSGLPTGQRQSGLPTGQRESGIPSDKRQHQPVTIVKEVDSASPKLLQALKQNEFLQVKLELNPSGKGPKTIDLQGATIVNFHPVKQGNRELEEIEFKYGKIEVTYSDGKKSYADDWEARQ